eukprot:COSAG01_NODE_8441_length_2783_cov_1.202607_4_plen_141_part_00
MSQTSGRQDTASSGDPGLSLLSLFWRRGVWCGVQRLASSFYRWRWRYSPANAALVLHYVSVRDGNSAQQARLLSQVPPTRPRTSVSTTGSSQGRLRRVPAACAGMLVSQAVHVVLISLDGVHRWMLRSGCVAASAPQRAL